MTNLSYGLNNLIQEVETSQYSGKKYLICQHDGWHVRILDGSNKIKTAHNMLSECRKIGWYHASIHTLESLYKSFLLDLRALAESCPNTICEAGVDTGYKIVEYKSLMFLPGASVNNLHCPSGSVKIIFLNKNHWETNEICEEIVNSCDDDAYRMDYNSVILPKATVLREDKLGLWIGVAAHSFRSTKFDNCQEVVIYKLAHNL